MIFEGSFLPHAIFLHRKCGVNGFSRFLVERRSRSSILDAKVVVALGVRALRGLGCRLRMWHASTSAAIASVTATATTTAIATTLTTTTTTTAAAAAGAGGATTTTTTTMYTTSSANTRLSASTMY